MISERDRQGLLRILDHCLRLRSYIPDNYTYKEFILDTEKQDAVVFNLIQIGELAKEILSDSCKVAISTIPWNIIIRMRHKIVHHYDDFNVSVVWRTVRDDIPSVEQTIRDYLNNKELSKMSLFDK